MVGFPYTVLLAKNITPLAVGFLIGWPRSHSHTYSRQDEGHVVLKIEHPAELLFKNLQGCLSGLYQNGTPGFLGLNGEPERTLVTVQHSLQSPQEREGSFLIMWSACVESNTFDIE